MTSADGISTAGLLNEGDTVRATVAFTKPVFLDEGNGALTLELTIGNQSVVATYLGGSGTDALLFDYTIAAGLTDVDRISIAADRLALSGTAILRDLAGNGAQLLHQAVR